MVYHSWGFTVPGNACVLKVNIFHQKSDIADNKCVTSFFPRGQYVISVKLGFAMAENV